jgi:hypothetical protein
MSAFTASSAGRASSQNEVGTSPATSQRKPSRSKSRSQYCIIPIMWARSAGTP